MSADKKRGLGKNGRRDGVREPERIADVMKGKVEPRERAARGKSSSNSNLAATFFHLAPERQKTRRPIAIGRGDISKSVFTAENERATRHGVE